MTYRHCRAILSHVLSMPRFSTFTDSKLDFNAEIFNGQRELSKKQFETSQHGAHYE